MLSIIYSLIILKSLEMICSLIRHINLSGLLISLKLIIISAPINNGLSTAEQRWHQQALQRKQEEEMYRQNQILQNFSLSPKTARKLSKPERNFSAKK